MKTFPQKLKQYALPLLMGGALALTGCDGATGPDDGADVVVEGRVTDESGYGKTASGIEGAVVTASEVSASGSLRTVGGEATTDAQGRYTLDAAGAADAFIVTAQKGAFRSRALVYTAADGTVRAMPMTVESKAEADVYVETRKNSNADAVTVADVAANVSSEVAADVEAGRTTAAEVAAALYAKARAEDEYVEDEVPNKDDDDVEEVRENEAAAFVRLQASLHASTSTSAETAAVRAFEEALVEAYTEADIALDAQAKARQSGRAALDRFGSGLSSQTRFALRKQAEVTTSMATALAVEAQFESAGASQARLNALAQARNSFVASLRAAASTAALENAQASYASTVEAELAAELSLSAAPLAAAKLALGSAKTALDLSLATAGTVGAVTSAYATFYTSAEAAVKASLSSTARAELAATVLTLLSIQ